MTENNLRDFCSLFSNPVLSAPQARAITAGPAPAATALESIFEREAKRNEKLERDMEQLSIEHRNEREALIREIRNLK